jgi:hypothetical protein
MENNIITDDILKKSLQILGIEDGAHIITKGEGGGASHDGGEAAVGKKDGKEIATDKGKEIPEGSKGGASKDGGEAAVGKKDGKEISTDKGEIVKGKKGFKKALKEMKGLKKSFKTEYAAKKDEIKKGFPEMWEKKKEKKAIKKALKSKKLNDEPLEKSLNNDLSGRIDASSNVLKAIISDNNAIKTSINESAGILAKLTEVVTQIGNQSMGRKSFTSVKAIEKSLTGDLGEDSGKIVLSVSRDKEKINDTLYNLSGLEKGEVNQLYVDAAKLFDASKQIEKNVTTDLFTKHNIKIVQ